MKTTKKDTQLQLLDHDDHHTVITDYQNDPHIYPNMWQFVFSLLGLTVGYGSFWRFPYLIYKNGGGIFLVPYLISMLIVGVPILYIQTAGGQMYRTSLPLIMKKIHPAFKMIGIAILLISLHVVAMYNILLTYSYRLIFSAFVVPLPFADQKINQTTYFKQTVLNQSSSINQFGSINPSIFIIFIISMLICHFIIKNGVKASGNLIIITATTPFILLFILFVRGLFLEGASQGLAYLFKPDWSKLWTTNIWIDAMVQVFYQFSVAAGTIFGLGSMKPRRQNFLTGVLAVPIGILVCGLLSAMTIFIYLSHFTQQIGMSMTDPGLKIAGPQLAFSVFPKALATLPLPNFWVFIFFITMVLLGIDSQFGMMQGLYCYLNHERHQNGLKIFGKQLTLQQAQYVLLFLILLPSPTIASSAGMYYLQFYDYFATNIPLPLAAIFQLYFFVYFVPFSQLEAAIVKYTNIPTPYIIRFFLQSKILVLVLGINFILGVFNQIVIFAKYSLGFYLFGWAITLYPIILAFLYWKKHWTSSADLKLTFEAIEKA